MRTDYQSQKQAMPAGYRIHRIPRREHRDYEEALAHAAKYHGDARRAPGFSGRYWLMYVPLEDK